MVSPIGVEPPVDGFRGDVGSISVTVLRLDADRIVVEAITVGAPEYRIDDRQLL